MGPDERYDPAAVDHRRHDGGNGKGHGLTLVTRNILDVARAGVPLINPFD
jgi:hypothetical protein